MPLSVHRCQSLPTQFKRNERLFDVRAARELTNQPTNRHSITALLSIQHCIIIGDCRSFRSHFTAPLEDCRCRMTSAVRRCSHHRHNSSAARAEAEVILAAMVAGARWRPLVIRVDIHAPDVLLSCDVAPRPNTASPVLRATPLLWNRFRKMVYGNDPWQVRRIVNAVERPVQHRRPVSRSVRAPVSHCRCST